MHPLPSVISPPFPRAPPRPPPSRCSRSGTNPARGHRSSGGRCGGRPRRCPKASRNLTSSHTSEGLGQQFLSPLAAGLGSWAPGDVGALLVAPATRGQAKVPKWARLPFIGPSVSPSEILASALHCFPRERAGGDAVLVSDLLETPLHPGLGRLWQQEPVGPWRLTPYWSLPAGRPQANRHTALSPPFLHWKTEMMR